VTVLDHVEHGHAEALERVIRRRDRINRVTAVLRAEAGTN
jgi:hypothetical protein